MRGQASRHEGSAPATAGAFPRSGERSSPFQMPSSDMQSLRHGDDGLLAELAWCGRPPVRAWPAHAPTVVSSSAVGGSGTGRFLRPGSELRRASCGSGGLGESRMATGLRSPSGAPSRQLASLGYTLIVRLFRSSGAPGGGSAWLLSLCFNGPRPGPAPRTTTASSRTEREESSQAGPLARAFCPRSGSTRLAL